MTITQAPPTPCWLEVNEVEAFRAHVAAEPSIYVAIDCEGDESHKGVTSVGVSILAPPLKGHNRLDISFGSLVPNSPDETTTSLDDIVSGSAITTHSIHISGRCCEAAKRSCSASGSRRTEPFRYGPTSIVPLTGLQEHIIEILGKLQHDYPSRPLHLIGWDITQDLRSLNQLCPSVLTFFAHWTDLGTIAARMSGIHAGRRQRSLRDVMIALGFSRNDGYTLQHFLCWTQRHDPGMDAVRIMATMLGLLARPVGTLVVRQETLREAEERKAKYKRPARERFPFSVRIGVGPGECLPVGLCGFEGLGNFVGRVTGKEPTVVHLCPKGVKETERTHGWICFEEVADMEHLVEEVDGMAVDSVSLQARLDGPQHASNFNEKTKREESGGNVIKAEYDQSLMEDLTPMLAWDPPGPCQCSPYVVEHESY